MPEEAEMTEYAGSHKRKNAEIVAACPVKLIISGGQSGADLAGNEFAKEMGIPTRCYIFEDFVPVCKGDREFLKKFECLNIKTDSADYSGRLRERTIFNVKRADATVIFLHIPLEQLGTYSGSRLTWKMCEVLKKPMAIAYVGDWNSAVRGVVDLISEYQPTILNVAGQRSFERKIVKTLLRDAWRRLV